MTELYNLVIELDRLFETPSISAIDVSSPEAAGEAMPAWIDDVFGGAWSSEAVAGFNIVARRGGGPIGFTTLNPTGLKYAWLEGIAREPGVAILGPLGVVPEERDWGVGTVLVRAGLNALRERGFARALIPAASSELLPFYADAVGAKVAERFDRAALYRPGRRVLALASGSGSNFQAVLDASRAGDLPIEIVGLLTNNEGAYAIERARKAGMTSIAVLPWNRSEESREQYDARLMEAARSREPDLVLLLGWMHLLSDGFVQHFPEMLNLHPAFLPLDPSCDDVVAPDGTKIPAFRGARAVRDALALSSGWVGATLHRVTSATDRGPVMARKPLRVAAEEGEEHLMERVHALERGVVRSGIMRWLYER